MDLESSKHFFLRETSAEEAKTLGLVADEYAAIVQHLHRAPTLLEAGIIAAMWSEHCAYKSSRIHLQQLPKTSPRVVVGPGENAGALDIGDDLCVVFKVESHNHPSFIEPFQGAATGAGGILRDIFTMGARPIATANLLRFGPKDDAKTPHLLEGVTRGLSSYGNCFGVANVKTDMAFGSSYRRNILVNAFALGIAHPKALQKGIAAGVGNPVIYVGAKTGRDGIHGATMASESFEDKAESKRPNVQIGDPFKEKLLLEACLDAFATDDVVGIQDMGAAGLTSSSFEMSERGKCGVRLWLDRVPQREANMTPYDLMLSESQERMLMVAKKGGEARLLSIFARYGLDASVIGEVIEPEQVELWWHGEQVCALDSAFLTNAAPKYDRPATKPQRAVPDAQRWHKHVVQMAWDDLMRLQLADPNLASRRPQLEQYDHHIGLGTLAHQLIADGALVQIPSSTKGIYIGIGCHEQLCAVDPREGTRRSVAVQVLEAGLLGAEPIGLSNCLNFGSPEVPEVMWQLKESLFGLKDASLAFDAPVVSGNVSLYNQTHSEPIDPTPCVTLVGLNQRCDRYATRILKRNDDVIVFAGHRSAELALTESFVHDDVRYAGFNETWSLPLVKTLSRACAALVQSGAVDTGAVVQRGGLLSALWRLRQDSDIGLKMDLGAFSPEEAKILLVSENVFGVVLSVARDRVQEVKACLAPVAFVATLGTTGGAALEISWQGQK